MQNTKELAAQLTNPTLQENHWKVEPLAKRLGTSPKRLKDWATRGWVTAVQRPRARTRVIFADAEELARLQRLVDSQRGQGRPAPPAELAKPKQIDR